MANATAWFWGADSQCTVRAPFSFDGIPLYLLDFFSKYRGMPSSFFRGMLRKRPIVGLF